MSGCIRLIYSTGSRRTYARNPIESKTNANKPTNSTIVFIVVNPGCATSKSTWILLVQSISPESPAPFYGRLPGWVRAGGAKGLSKPGTRLFTGKTGKTIGMEYDFKTHFRVRERRDLIRHKYDPAGGGLILSSYGNRAFLVRFRR